MAKELVPTTDPAPLSLTASDGTGLRIVALSARGVVQDPLCFTELQLTFENPEARQIEGHFDITLPPGATISRFAMRQDSGWQEGEVVELQAARRAYEDFLHRRQDPALLEKQPGNHFRARVFPIPPSGQKELILSYSQERQSAAEPYRIHLRGLPVLEQLDIRVIVASYEAAAEVGNLGGTTMSQRIVKLSRSAFVPDADFEVPVPPAPTGPRVGLRHDNLVVARIVPAAQARPDALQSLLVLFDTSASRALGFDALCDRLFALLAALRERQADLAVRLCCFDQDVVEIFHGSLRQLSDSHRQQIAERGALGASDLSAALAYASKPRAHGGRPYSRVLFFTDGIVTMGETEGHALRAAAQQLGEAGVERLDVLTGGGIRDEALLKELVGLGRGGVVADDTLATAELVRRLTSATLSGVRVTVPGSQWVWPTELNSVQPGDQVLVYADLPRDRPFAVTLAGGEPQLVTLADVERPLLERAWVNARISRLLHQRDTMAAGDSDLRDALRHQIIELSTRHRVLCDFTALLVLETEADYARFNIDRRALADILTVGPTGVEVQSRKRGPLPPPVPEVARSVPAMSPKLAKKSRRADDHERLRSEPLMEPALDRPQSDVQGPASFSEDEAGESDYMSAPAPAPGAPAMAAAPAPPAAQAYSAPPPPSSPPMMSLSAPMPVAAAPASRPRPAPAMEMEREVAAPSLLSRAVSAIRRESPAAVASLPYQGPLLEVMQLLRSDKLKEALAAARRWQKNSPGDVLALVALGEALEALGKLAEAARVYGSIIDLFPGRADLRRFAGQRLDRLGDEGLQLAVDTYRKARAQRPDHPSSHRLLAFALCRAGAHADAFTVIAEGSRRSYPPQRFPGVPRILKEDVGLVAAAWMRTQPEERAQIANRLREEGATLPTQPSLRFVLNWETDANDVDFHIHDSKGGHAYFSSRVLPSGGELYADVTTGYGPECFTIEGKPTAYPYKLQAHYYSRGPMGYGMGKLEIIEHDGKGDLRFEERPFVIMEDRAFVDLGEVTGPLGQQK